MKKEFALSIVLSLLTLFAHAESIFSNTSCIPSTTSCEFYDKCLEQNKSCGAQGYALSYGKHYCNKFFAIEKKLSPQGQLFFQDTRTCLQRELLYFLHDTPAPLCSAISDTAFDSHPYCYTSGKISICSLDVTHDLPLIFSEYEALDMFTGNSAKQMRDVAAICLAQLYQKATHPNWSSRTSTDLTDSISKIEFWSKIKSR